MTTNELRKKFNDDFGIDRPWPKSYKVDAETYGYVLQSIINNLCDKGEVYRLGNTEIGQYYEYRIKFGTHNGLMFKNVELILETK